ncbi:MAG TPA: Nif3-like dinuclear metal center hexameric protein [Gemmataceae bacterium]|nr:Nif3-like dinuclear metal center hexameric protein [Gemmataceae bacterium]
MSTTQISVASVTSALQAFAPLSVAAEWDNVGLLLGDAAAPVQRVMTCLTVTPDSVAEAIEAGVNLIVSHHPILFRATKKLTTATAEGRMLLNLVQAGIAVFSPHTAFDNCAGGINDQLAQKLGLTSVGPLRTGLAESACKVVVFVPDKDLARVSDALFAAGAGQIGQYRECSFRLAGTGTFFGTESTNPTIGEKGRREDVSEWRLEVACPERRVDAVIAAMRAAHSYEEPAYDVYPLRRERTRLGEGRLGTLPAPMSLEAFARLTRDALQASSVQTVGAAQRSLRRVALACGAAGEFLSDAIAQQADVFLTGELRFHDCLAAQTSQIALVLPGHYATERGGVEALAGRLQQQFPALQVWASRRERDPLASALVT